MASIRTPKTVLTLAMTGLLSFSITSQACGPDLPNRLLTYRNSTLMVMPEGDFYFEANKLLPADPKLPVMGVNHPELELEPSVQTIIDKMREQQTAEAAYALGEGLTPAARLYTAGAVDPEKRAEYFQKIFLLPKEEQGEWGIMAHYTLGSDLVSSESDDTQQATALEHFDYVINAVKTGQKDTLNLAISSLGQQARILWWQGKYPESAHLYAQQAAQGDGMGILSLKFVVGKLLNDDSIRQKSLHDPLIQQLTIAGMFTRIDPHFYTATQSVITKRTDKILDELNKNVSDAFPNMDRLAALAYQAGQYDSAANILKRAGDTGLAWWLRAKLSLRNGDINSATDAYAKAATAFPSNEEWGNQRGENFALEYIIPSCRISAEQSILALKRDDFVQAMTLMYNTRNIYYQDVSDIAERVLTIEELKTFVDKHAPRRASSAKEDEEEGEEYEKVSSLRELLARRLMRAERYQEAIDYFVISEHRKNAERFIQALEKTKDKNASKKQLAIDYYQAALIMREQGLEIRGYEMAPDFNESGGNSFNRESLFSSEAVKSSENQPWISPAQLTRAKTSLPKTDDWRFHYRWRAMELAVKSADLLPPKSEAYAAVMCEAASWVIARDPATASTLYRTYTKNGTQYDWSPQFGRSCPKVNFEQS